MDSFGQLPSSSCLRFFFFFLFPSPRLATFRSSLLSLILSLQLCTSCVCTGGSNACADVFISFFPSSLSFYFLAFLFEHEIPVTSPPSRFGDVPDGEPRARTMCLGCAFFRGAHCRGSAASSASDVGSPIRGKV